MTLHNKMTEAMYTSIYDLYPEVYDNKPMPDKKRFLELSLYILKHVKYDKEPVFDLVRDYCSGNFIWINIKD